MGDILGGLAPAEFSEILFGGLALAGLLLLRIPGGEIGGCGWKALLRPRRPLYRPAAAAAFAYGPPRWGNRRLGGGVNRGGRGKFDEIGGGNEGGAAGPEGGAGGGVTLNRSLVGTEGSEGGGGGTGGGCGRSLLSRYE